MAGALKTIGLVGLCAALVLLCALEPAWACPSCKDSLAQNDPARASLVRGYFWSILFMMSMPFLIFSGLSGYFYWQIRRARALEKVAFTHSSQQLTGCET